MAISSQLVEKYPYLQDPQSPFFFRITDRPQGIEQTFYGKYAPETVYQRLKGTFAVPISSPEELQRLTGAATPDAGFQNVVPLSFGEALGFNLRGAEAGEGGTFFQPGTNIGNAPIPALTGFKREFDAGELAGIQEKATFQLPEIQNSLQSALSIQDNLPSLSLSFQSLQTQIQNDLKQAREERKTLLEKAKDIFQPQKTQQQITEEIFSKYGITPENFTRMDTITKEVGTLNKQLVDLQSEKQKAINVVSESPIPMGLIQGRQAEIEKQYNQRINALAAQTGAKATELEALRGNIMQARTIAGDVIQAATADLSLRVQGFQFFMTANEQLIDDLSKQEKDLVDRQFETAKFVYQVEKERLSQITDLILKAPGQGISLSDSLSSALEKAQPLLQRENELNQLKNLLGQQNIQAQIDERQLNALNLQYKIARDPLERMKLQEEINATKALTLKRLSDISDNNNIATITSEQADYLANQVYNRQVDFNQLGTRAERIAVVNSLQKRGLSIPRNLTAKEKSAMNDATSGLQAVEELQNMFNKNELPLYRGTYLPSFAARLTGASKFITLSGEATDIKTRIRTGAALNESEIKFYNNQTPRAGDSKQDIQFKLNQLRGFYLGMSGLPITVQNPKTGKQYLFNDLFKQEQRLALRRAINAGYQINY